jgi:DNA-3-methyladenine glycosylase II
MVKYNWRIIMLSTNKTIADYLKSKDKVMELVIGDEVIIERSRDMEPFVSLASIIVYQQLSGTVANVIFTRLKSLMDQFTPEAMTQLSDEQLRNIGLSKQKVSYLRSLCEYAATNSMSYEFFDTKNNEQLLSSLLSIKGIGPWSAEMFMMFTLGREDVFSIKDAGLMKAINYYYGEDGELSKEQILSLSNSWQPYRTYACLYLWNSLTRIK